MKKHQPTYVRPSSMLYASISFKQEQKAKGKRCSIPIYPCISSSCSSTTITGPNCHMMPIRLWLVPNIHQHVQVTCELCYHTIPLHAYKMHTFPPVKTGYQIGSDPRQHQVNSLPVTNSTHMLSQSLTSQSHVANRGVRSSELRRTRLFHRTICTMVRSDLRLSR